VPNAEAPEFSLERPLPSALAVIRAVLFSPRNFYAHVSGLLFGEVSAGEVRLTALEALIFALLSPLALGVVAGVYLLSIRTFVGKASSFREVYRMAAYACGTLILAWIPIVGAFAITYALIVLMGIGIRLVYRTSFLTAVVTAVASFTPISVALIWLRVTTAGLASL
jgi:hypothetical protein